MKNSILILLLAIILFNCKSAKPVTKPVVIQPATDTAVVKIPGIELSGTWELQKIWGSGSENKWNTQPEININLDDKTFTGNTGCNSMSGRFTIKENFITFDKQIITTKMACIGYNETPLLSILLKINRYTVEDNVLELSQNDIVLMRLLKK